MDDGLLKISPDRLGAAVAELTIEQQRYVYAQMLGVVAADRVLRAGRLAPGSLRAFRVAEYLVEGGVPVPPHITWGAHLLVAPFAAEFAALQQGLSDADAASLLAQRAGAPVSAVHVWLATREQAFRQAPGTWLADLLAEPDLRSIVADPD
jgi:hypothetical protein